MVVLIFLKWAIPWNTDAYPTSQAPSIIGIFIKMALSPGSWDPVNFLPSQFNFYPYLEPRYALVR